MSTVQDILKTLDDMCCSVLQSLDEIEELDLPCKSVLQQNLINRKVTNDKSPVKIQAVIDYMYEKINIGNWKEVKVFLRKTITIASFIKLFSFLNTTVDINDSVLKELFKIIDFGILFGCPLDKAPNLLQNCASILSSYKHEESNGNHNIKIEEVDIDRTNYGATLIPKIECPSMEHFYKQYILEKQPVVLLNCMNHWPALTKWKDQEYFIKLAGLRTVSIELGSKYTDSDWTQKLMTVEDFIQQHIYETSGPTGYLAQYQLFDQIPELKKDIIEPEYCCFSDNSDPVDVNAWYGPKGTVSPLHHDPKKNLLSQVIGEKLLFLFSPEDSEYLYPHEHKLLNNTAQVDPRAPNLEKYPKYKEAKAYYCVLKPGQMLYIPPKWWHFVESLSISFSVSFWWE